MSDVFAETAKQSRKASLIESLANVVIGFVVAFICNMIVLPAFGVAISVGTGLEVTVIFTVVSIARSFALRRSFEALRINGWLS